MPNGVQTVPLSVIGRPGSAWTTRANANFHCGLLILPRHWHDKVCPPAIPSPHRVTRRLTARFQSGPILAKRYTAAVWVSPVRLKTCAASSNSLFWFNLLMHARIRNVRPTGHPAPAVHCVWRG